MKAENARLLSATEPEIKITIHEAIIEAEYKNGAQCVNCFLHVSLRNEAEVETNISRYSIVLKVSGREYIHVAPIQNINDYYLSITAPGAFSDKSHPEEIEAKQQLLEDLASKISEHHILTKGHSKSGWLGFTAYNLNLPDDVIEETEEGYDEHGRVDHYQVWNVSIPRTETIEEIILTVVDGYEITTVSSAKAPFRKEGRRIKSK